MLFFAQQVYEPRIDLQLRSRSDHSVVLFAQGVGEVSHRGWVKVEVGEGLAEDFDAALILFGNDRGRPGSFEGVDFVDETRSGEDRKVGGHGANAGHNSAGCQWIRNRDGDELGG